MRKRLLATVPVTIRAAEQGGDGKRRFTLVAYTGEPMNVGWGLPVVVDCSSVNYEQQALPALLDHCPTGCNIVGQIEQIAFDTPGVPPLIVSGYFTPTDEEEDAARLVLKKADAGFIWQASIGGDPATVEEVKPGVKVQVNGREYVGPIQIARGVVLREVSFVVLGADRKTTSMVANHKGIAMNWNEWLAAKGYDAASLTASQKTALKSLFAAEGGLMKDDEEGMDCEDATDAEKVIEGEDATGTSMTDEEDDTTEEDPPVNAAADAVKLKAQLADANRQLGVARVLARCGNPKLTVGHLVATAEEHANKHKWDARETELRILRAKRAEAPNVIVKNNQVSMQALQGAMLLRAGGKLDSPAYNSPYAAELLKDSQWLRAGLNDAQRNQFMDNAHKFAKMSAMELARQSLIASGRMVPMDRDEMLQAAFSSGSLTNSMTTSVNAILLSTYLESTDTTRGWVRENEVPNYLTAERVRVLKGDSLEELPEDGEADHSTIADTAESYKIKRFAKQFQIDEIAFLNDNLGALATKPTEFGLAAARLRPDLVYATIYANPTLASTGRALFNSTDANLITSSALAKSTLGTALARMSVIKENGVNIDVDPSHLIIPPTLRETAAGLLTSDYWITGENATMGNRNTLKDWGLTLVAEKRLENGVTHPSTKTVYSGSTSTWYLASATAPALEVGYLRGQRVPRVRSGQLDRGKFGTWWDVSHSIGVCVLDWKGIEKITA